MEIVKLNDDATEQVVGIVDSRASEAPPVGFTDLGVPGLSMSNLDGSIDEGLEETLKGQKVFCRHAAWNFNGRVWWDGSNFREQVWRYHAPVKTFAAPTLESLMQFVNDEFGWE